MSTTRRKLLLADDSATIRRVVELSFDGEAVDIIWVPEGHAVPSTVEREQPHVLLVDLSLPGRDGYDLCAWVNASGLRDRLPVVVMAGAFETVDRNRLEQLGAAAIVTKPVEPASLVALVAELIDVAAEGETSAISAPVHGTPAASPEGARDQRSRQAQERAERSWEESGGNDATEQPGIADNVENRPATERDLADAAVPSSALASASLVSGGTSAGSHVAGEGDGDFLDQLGAALAAAGYAVPVGGPLGASSVTRDEAATVALHPIGLAEGFAAVLEAEQHGVPLQAQPSVVPAAQVLSSAVIDEIARRVAARLVANPAWVRGASESAAAYAASPVHVVDGGELGPSASASRT